MKVLPIKEITIETGGILSLRPPDLSDFVHAAIAEIADFNADEIDYDRSFAIDDLWKATLTKDELEEYERLEAKAVNGNMEDYDKANAFFDSHGVHVCFHRCGHYEMPGTCEIDKLFHKPMCRACAKFTCALVLSEENKRIQREVAAFERKHPLIAAERRKERRFRSAEIACERFVRHYENGEYDAVACLIDHSEDYYMKLFERFPYVFDGTVFGNLDGFKKAVASSRQKWEDAKAADKARENQSEGESDNG